MIEPGRVVGVPVVRNWKSDGSSAFVSESRSATGAREAYFASLASRLAVPGAEIVLDRDSADSSWRTANLLLMYPQRQAEDLGGLLRPFVLLEVGSA